MIAALFTANDVEVRNLETDKIEPLDLPAYKTAYVEGYKSGLAYFSEEYRLPPSVLYGANLDRYVSNLHTVCSKEHTEFGPGWSSATIPGHIPYLLTRPKMKQYGYYAALVRRVEELSAQHPALFRKWQSGNPTPETVAGEQPGPETFEDLFINAEDIKPCVDALRRIWPDKPIISDTNQWQKRDGSKAVLAAWIRRLEDCPKIHFIRPINKLVPLLNTYFPNLELGKDARTLKDPDVNLVAEFAALILP